MLLMLPGSCSSTIRLEAGQGPRTLGRALLQGVASVPAQVSRVHCQVEVPADRPQTVRLTSLSELNPTLVLRSVAGGPGAVPRPSPAKQLLFKGQSADLAHGDAFSLAADLEEVAIQVVCARATTGSGATAPLPPQGPVSASGRGSVAARGAAHQTPSLSGAGPAQVEAGSGQPVQALDIQALQGLQQEPETSQPQEQQQVGHLQGEMSASRMEGRAQPVVLLLIGAPGSGKSTFSKSLLRFGGGAIGRAHGTEGAQAAAAPGVKWVHVNQDSISSKGTPGSREQCLAAVKAGLAAGSCVVVDRCHIDAEQRSQFIALATAMGCPSHAVVFSLPVQVCVERAVGRSGHPGKVEGPGAAAVVKRFAGQLLKNGPPTNAEGLQSVMECSSDAEVAVALKAWCNYGTPPAAGSKGTTPAVPVAAASAAGAEAGAGQAVDSAACDGLDPWQYWLTHKPKTPASAAAVGAKAATLDTFFKKAAGKAAPAGGKALPSGAGVVAGKRGASQGTAVTALVAAGAVTPGAAVELLRTASEDEEDRPAKRAKTGTGEGLVSGSGAAVAATKGTSTLSPSPAEASAGSTGTGGGGPQPPGQALTGGQQQQHTQKHQPSGSQQGQQPQGTAAQGQGQGSQPQEQPVSRANVSSGGGGAKQPANAFAALMSGARKQAAAVSGKAGGSQGAGASKAAGGEGGSQAAGSRDARFPPFAQQLWHLAMDPSRIRREEHPDAHVDSQCIRLRDIYPKAAHHALVLPRERGLDSPAELRAHHLPLLEHMRAVAMHWVWRVGQAGAGSSRPGVKPGGVATFRLGFHTLPSMRQLHLHVISQDLCGVSLKKKEHYQRFATPFFISLDEAVRQLREHGQLHIDTHAAEQLLKGPMCCHRCGASSPTPGGKPFNFPQLKAHLEGCTAPYQGADAVGIPEQEPELPAGQ